MHNFSKALVEARLADLQREARQPRDRTAARHAVRNAAPAPPRTVTIRVGTPDDMPALKRLAALDSSHIPTAPVLLAEVDGELRAALSLSGSGIIADPFRPTAPLVQVMVKWAKQARDDRSPRLRRLRAALRQKQGRNELMMRANPTFLLGPRTPDCRARGGQP